MNDDGMNLMTLHTVEKDGREQWVHLLPAGTFSGRDGRGPYRLSDANAVMRATREYQGKAQLPVDYEHQSLYAPKTGVIAPAAGWIKGLQARDTGLWGLVEWTETAARQVKAREFRYLSPVFKHRGGVVTRLAAASLTQYPNLDLVAVNRAGGNMDPIAELRQLFELSENANAADVVAKAKELLQGTATHSTAPDPTKYVPIGDFERAVSELNKVRQGVSETEAAHAVEQSVTSGRLPPFLRDWGVSLCTVNKPAFDAFIERTKGPVGRLFTGEVPTGFQPGRGGEAFSGLSDEEASICRSMGLTADEFRAPGLKSR